MTAVTPVFGRRWARTLGAALALGIIALLSSRTFAQSSTTQASTSPADASALSQAHASGAIHHGVLVADQVQWTSHLAVTSPHAATHNVQLRLLRPLPHDADVKGAQLQVDRQTLVFRLDDLAFDSRRSRHRVLQLQTTQPLLDAERAQAVPLVGAPAERITTEGFTLDVAPALGVDHGVRHDIAPGVSREARKALERHTKGATPLGALYVGPSPQLRTHGLLATVVDDRSAQTVLGFATVGLGVLFAFALGAWWLRRSTAQERAQAVLDADLDEIARWQNA